MVRVLSMPLMLGVVAAVLIVVGLVVGGPGAEIEGAYFNRSVGQDAGSVVLSEGGGPGLFNPSDGNLWLGGGIALAVVAVGTAVASRRRVSG